MIRKERVRLLAVLATFGTAATVFGADFFEAEPNDSKAAANVFLGLMPGDRIIGNSTASSGAGLDYFLISTAADALGIYRYRMVLTSDIVGHTGTIRGLNQIAAPAGPWPGPVGTPGTTDSVAQTTSTTTTPPRFNQWYGFGKGEQLYYRVTGTASTTANYTATLEKTAVTPTDLGTFQAGTIIISTIGQTTLDTDLWVYDGAFNAILGYGNDDESTNGGGTGATTQSILGRTYGAGRYYLAMSRFNLANNQGSPCDDDFRTGTMLDFADGVLSSSSTTTTVSLGFKVTDSLGTTTVPGFAPGPYDINWYTFEVVPEPSTLAAVGAGIAALLARRRKR
ncbi:MAG: PEP-CTERM sorting domain-containing protein [Armatimonadetes bacterium]|nr:PEP-CTERM sorting domain-containing protein [Armatimonadota bacterium]NOG93032.1 PEP-CTERM sorting domain-containing protein [Armatimonadota bacterium]